MSSEPSPKLLMISHIVGNLCCRSSRCLTDPNLSPCHNIGVCTWYHKIVNLLYLTLKFFYVFIWYRSFYTIFTNFLSLSRTHQNRLINILCFFLSFQICFPRSLDVKLQIHNLIEWGQNFNENCWVVLKENNTFLLWLNHKNKLCLKNIEKISQNIWPPSEGNSRNF